MEYKEQGVVLYKSRKIFYKAPHSGAAQCSAAEWGWRAKEKRAEINPSTLLEAELLVGVRQKIIQALQAGRINSSTLLDADQLLWYYKQAENNPSTTSREK